MKISCTKGFKLEEIIFCPTALCNLKCAHCFVEQKNIRLDVEDSLSLLRNCAEKNPDIKVGFSGGEPFLNFPFVKKIVEEAIELGLMFDRLMTNGVWWNSVDDMKEKLTQLKDAGFDGKIGLSFDFFHGQDLEKVCGFIQVCHEIFCDDSCVEILSVINSTDEKKDSMEFEKQIESIKSRTRTSHIATYRFPQSFIPPDKIELKDKKWFAEDYCQSTGNVFYIHADGNIAPCCGFANECSELYVGTVKDDYETLIHNIENNSMTSLCYNYGLLKKARELQKLKILPKGKCSDMCGLCYWLCKNRDN